MTTFRNAPRIRRDERGAYLIIFALVIIAIFAIIAIVLDVAALRQDRAANRSAADASVTAAALTLFDDDSQEACVTAWDYFLQNTPGALSATPLLSPPCDDDVDRLPTKQECVQGASDKTVTGRAGDYTVTISYPVDDLNDLMRHPDTIGLRTQEISASDGSRCTRIGVTIRFERDHRFGQLLGVDSGATISRSVAIASSVANPGDEAPALVALEKHDTCTIDANNRLIKAFSVDDKPAIIQADSDGSNVIPCSTGASPAVYFTAGGASGFIEAQAGTTQAGRLGHVAPTSPVNVAFNQGPEKIIGDRFHVTPITRRPVDAKYHCEASTPSCPDGQVDFFKDFLEPFEEGEPGDSLPGWPTDFEEFPAEPGDNCASPPSAFDASVKNWYIDCPTFRVTDTVSFGGGGVIIFTGKVLVHGGELRINNDGTDDSAGRPVASSPHDTILVVRSNAQDAFKLQNTGDRARFARTTVFNLGGVDFRGGPRIRWTAPPSGPGEHLLYWGESTQALTMQGGPELFSDGVFFAPNASLEMSGSGTTDARLVQMWVRRAEMQGNTQLLLKPNPETAIATFSTESRLIR